MPIVTPETWAVSTGRTLTSDADKSSIAAACVSADAMIKQAIKPFLPEPATQTVIIDAPPHEVLLLPVVPVRSITTVHVARGADGDSAEFTSDNLLTAYEDYYLPIDDPIEGYSRSGRLLRRSASAWGVERYRLPFRLGSGYHPERGSVRVVYEAGPTALPEDLAAAGVLVATLLFERRKSGFLPTSESWNGYSRSIGGPFGMVGVLETPDVAGILARYRTVHIA